MVNQLLSHDALEVTDNRWEWVRPHRAPNQIVRVSHIGHPVPHGFVDGVLQCCLSIMDQDHLCPQSVHPEDIELLPLAVHSVHVHRAVQSQLGANGRRGDAVLPCPHLGNDARLSNLLGQECLSDGVVDLVRTHVHQILALEPDGCPVAVFCELVGLVEGGGSTNKVATIHVQLGKEVGSDLIFSYSSLISRKASDSVSGMNCPPMLPKRVLRLILETSSATSSSGLHPRVLAWLVTALSCLHPALRSDTIFLMVARRSTCEFPAASMALRMALSTMTPSPRLDTLFTIWGFKIPNPTASGRSVRFLTLAMKSLRSGGSSSLTPVTPVVEMQ